MSTHTDDLLDASPRCIAPGCRRLLAPFCVEHRDDVVSRQNVEALRAEAAGLREALAALLDRIDSEPTMSGHLRNVRLRPDHGGGHQTSDAIRAAKVVLGAAQEPEGPMAEAARALREKARQEDERDAE